MMRLQPLLLGLIAGLFFFSSAEASAAPQAWALRMYAQEPLPTAPFGMRPVSVTLPSAVVGVPREPTRSFNPKFRDWSYGELEEEKSKFGVGWPIILLGIGAPLSIVAGYYTLWSLGEALDPVPSCSGCGARAVVWGVATGVGIGLGLWGSFSLGSKIKARGELNTETEMRDRVRRRSPRHSHGSLTIQHGPIAVPLGLGWGASGQF